MTNSGNDAITVVSVTYESSAVVPTLAATLSCFRHVVIVDNASRDDTVAQIKGSVPHAAIIQAESNLGFGAANNLGMTTVKTPFALLLNPDCKIGDGDVAYLLAAATDFLNAALVAPQGCYPNGSLQESYRCAFFRPRTAEPMRVPDGICSAEWLNGCCMLVRVAHFRAIGGFDEGYFLYYEEDDLCLRAIAAGYDCLLEPRARVVHAGGRSSKPSTWLTLFKGYHYARSRYRISGKYLGRRSAVAYRCKIALVAPVAVLLHLFRQDRASVLRWLGWGSFAWRPW